MAAVGDGGYVVVWGNVQDGDGDGVFGQRYDKAGQVVGTEFQVNSYTTSSQGVPEVAGIGDGSFVVVWRSQQDGDDLGVFGQRYDSAGQAEGTEFQVNSYTMGDQSYQAVAAAADGIFVMAWTSHLQDGSGSGVFGQRYNSSGQAVGTEFQINSYTIFDQSPLAIAASGNGAFVAVWESRQGGSILGVFGQRYNSVGQAEGTEFQIDTYRVSSQRRPSVAAGGGGDFVVAWESLGQDRSSIGVFARRYDSAGKAMGNQFQINSYTMSDQGRPAVAAGADGAFVVVWQSYEQDDYSFGVFGQRLFAEPVPCPGDCRGDGMLSVDELITGVAIALNQLPIQDCDAFDVDESGQITIDELVAAVDAALNGCTD